MYYWNNIIHAEIYKHLEESALDYLCGRKNWRGGFSLLLQIIKPLPLYYFRITYPEKGVISITIGN